MNETVVTPAGLERLMDELDRLKTVERQRIAERIREATEAERNLAENADYFDAKEEQLRIEQRIARLEHAIAHASIAEPTGVPADRVAIGRSVRVREDTTDEEAVYELVGQLEADLDSARISHASPVGKALLGARRGDTVAVKAPQGTRRLHVLDVWEPDSFAELRAVAV